MTKLLSHFLQKKGVVGMIGRWSDVSEKWDAPVWQPLYQESKKSCYGVEMECTPCAKMLAHQSANSSEQQAWLFRPRRRTFTDKPSLLHASQSFFSYYEKTSYKILRNSYIFTNFAFW